MSRERRGKQAWIDGILAEWVAIVFLRLKGFKVLHHRYRTPFGEIDVIAQKGTTVICVEVKFRRGGNDLAHSVTAYQKARIVRATLYFSRKIPENFSIRFDVLLIKPWRFPVHIENAWDAHY